MSFIRGKKNKQSDRAEIQKKIIARYDCTMKLSVKLSDEELGKAIETKKFPLHINDKGEFDTLGFNCSSTDLLALNRDQYLRNERKQKLENQPDESIPITPSTT